MPPAPSWGLMLQAAASVRTTADSPWLLAPAGAIVATVFVIYSVSGHAAYLPGSRRTT